MESDATWIVCWRILRPAVGRGDMIIINVIYMDHR